MDWIWIFGCQISGGKRRDPARPQDCRKQGRSGETPSEGGREVAEPPSPMIGSVGGLPRMRQSTFSARTDQFLVAFRAELPTYLPLMGLPSI